MNQSLAARRPPRLQPELPFGEHEIPSPPGQQRDNSTRLAQVILPLVSITGYILFTAFGGNGRSPWLLVPMALSVLASIAFALYAYRCDHVLRVRTEQEYTDQLLELNQAMRTAHDLQRRAYRYTYPDPATILRLARQMRAAIERPTTAGPPREELRLWERRPGDTDFGVVRLGTGSRPSTVLYILRNSDYRSAPLLREAQKLASDSRIVTDVPLTIRLRPHPVTQHRSPAATVPEPPVCHGLAIAGERQGVYELTRALLAHAVTLHAPADLNLLVLASRRVEWAWTVGLPHTQHGDDQQPATYFAAEVAQAEPAPASGEGDESPLAAFLEGLRKRLAQRKLRLQEPDETVDEAELTRPWLLLVVDLLEVAATADDPLHELATDPVLSVVLAEGASLGASIIWLVPRRALAPGGCGGVIEVERTTPTTNSRGRQTPLLHFRYAEVGLNSARMVGQADAITTTSHLDALAQAMTGLTLPTESGSNLPKAVPLLSLLGYRSLAELSQAAQTSWTSSVQPEQATWLRARLGLVAGNKPRTLVFSAKRDGVHGVVAGSTGSGKSELLISLVTTLAAHYDPSVLNFVLVDYKGGGAFAEFRQLPHCVDLITNLQGDGVNRMFTAIQAELHRRQALNTRTSTRTIVEYRRKGLHLSGEPYPFLFIIIDEFAEMIAERAEYKTQLESITRVGRAQGVSLLLAAQRPSGITDQMRSNIKFRLCLRVETASESRELLRRVEAAYLPTNIPGRGYLQVGNEEIELIQVAYAGEPYRDPNQPVPPVLWPDRPSVGDEMARDSAPPELSRAIVTALSQLAEHAGSARQLAPWPAQLPSQLALTDPLTATDDTIATVTADRYLTEVDRITLGGEREPVLTLAPALERWLDEGQGWVMPLDWERYALRPVVGLVDHPQAAHQRPLVVDLPRGHALILGASGWGKTVFLRTLCLSLASSHSPSALHLYLLDLGGRNLVALAALPHVGAVISPNEAGYEERVEQLLRELDTIVEQRKLLFGAAGATSLAQYNTAHPDAPLAGIVVGIDNLVELVATFGKERDHGGSLLDQLIALARQSRAYGVHFVITASQLAGIPSALLSILTERFALHLTDSSEYRSIVGHQLSPQRAIPGRGQTVIDKQPLVFQVATAISELDGLVRPMVALIEARARQGQPFGQPVRVDALPQAVLLKHLLARELDLPLDHTFLDGLRAHVGARWQASRSAAAADWLAVPIGSVAGNRPRTLRLEAKRDGVHGIIAGGTGSGKSEFLATLIVSLALRYDPSVLNLVLVDYKGGGAFQPFRDLPQAVATISNLNRAAVKRMFTAIRAELERRQKLNADTGTKDIVDYRRQGLHDSHQPYPFLLIIIDEYAEMIGDNPEFRHEIDSITRVGRAQGVHLLLASQRPTGVSDQMRANMKLRLCLRVEQPDISRELLRRSDAALLPNGLPGRGYLQVGNDQLELIQVAYAGDLVATSDDPERGEQPRFFEAAVRIAQQVLAAAGGERPRPPWPPFLPTNLTLVDAIADDYLAPAARAVMTLGRPLGEALNPWVASWLAGSGHWPGIDWSSQALRAVVGLVDDPVAARQLPLVIDLNRGQVVLFGASGWGKTTLLRSLAVGLAATHAPSELHIHVVDLGGRSLSALRELPHVGSVILPDERGYEERMQQLWRELQELIDQRKRRWSDEGHETLADYNQAHPTAIEPAVLVIIDNIAAFLETFGPGASAEASDDQHGPFVELVRQGRAYGIHVIVTATRLMTLSSKLYSLFAERLTLRLANADDYSGIVGSGLDEIEEVAGRGAIRLGRQALHFQVAQVPRPAAGGSETATLRALGAAMRPLAASLPAGGRPPFQIDALPETVAHRELLAAELGISSEPASFGPALGAAVAANWSTMRRPETADWLQVSVAIGAGRRPRRLTFSATGDGVHGLIAGGTGSGKSELLMTLIVGLALRYPPDLLNFVLVDYKGGGAFRPFERLPHCVDVVTNLDKAAVNRMFTAINAEIRRRQALNASTGTKDIVDYRRRGLHLSHQPYPHLCIIIDEYAEMIDDNPDYRQQLESITRVGRAQGINLLLASQRPKGVSDQMRANIKLRLCLRVEQIETSRELLRRPDAALLPSGQPGRGYLQVGNDAIELIQVAYAGEVLSEPDSNGEPVRFYDAMIGLVARLAGRMAPRLWPTFLPASLSLNEPHHQVMTDRQAPLDPAVAAWLNEVSPAAQPADRTSPWPVPRWSDDVLRPVIGLLDDPAEARQEPYRLDLGRGHLAIMGDTGSGKTTLVRTLLVSLAATHSPAHLHLYCLDLGGRGLRSLAGLPHLGAMIYADEEHFEERLERLLERLTELADLRAQHLAEAGAVSLFDYNARVPARPLPAVVVVIDNIAVLQENHAALIDSGLVPLARRSLSVGITFVMTGTVPSTIPGKLYGLVTERLTFRQSNPDRYLDIVGRGATEIGDQPGRGFLRRGRRPLAFQAALPASHPGLSETEALQHLADRMQAVVAGWPRWSAPAPIRTLAEHLTLAALLPAIARADGAAVLGQRADLQPLRIDLAEVGPHALIVGPPLSGRTTTLRSWVLSLAEASVPGAARIVLVDLQRKLFEEPGSPALAELPHVIATIGDEEELVGLVERLEQEGAQLEAGTASGRLFVVIDNFDELSDELERDRELVRRLVRIIRRYGRAGLHLIVATGTDSLAGELRRRLQAAACGIGLRSAAAVEALRVMRTPPALRHGELPSGRGYFVHAGRAVLVQLAEPGPAPGHGVNGAPPADAAQRTTIADWVIRGQRRYPVRAQWSGTPSAITPVGAESVPVLGAVEARLWPLLQAALRQEADQPVVPASDSLLMRLVALPPARWTERTTLIDLLRDYWQRQMIARGLTASAVAELARVMDDDSLIFDLTASLTNGRPVA